MSTQEIAAPRQLLDVRTGELLPATVENAAAVIQAVREREQKLAEIKRDAAAFLAEESARRGTKTFHVDHGKVTLTGGPETSYDAVGLEQGLRDAGCPEDRIREVVVEEVSYKVDRRILRQMVGANPAYAAAAEAAKIVTDKPFRAEVKGAL